MLKKLWSNLMVADVNKAIDFYTELQVHMLLLKLHPGLHIRFCNPHFCSCNSNLFGLSRTQGHRDGRDSNDGRDEGQQRQKQVIANV